MTVEWWPEAVRDFDRIESRLSYFSPAAGRAFAWGIRHRVSQLIEFPFSGPIIAEFEAEGFRQLSFGQYRLLYLAHTDRLEIVAVVHGAMDLQSSRD